MDKNEGTVTKRLDRYVSRRQGRHVPLLRVALCALYAAVVVLPLLIAGRFGWLFSGNIWGNIGRSLGLAGYAALALQVVLTARLKWVSMHFGLDRAIRFHRTAGMVSAALILSHPVLLAAGSGRWALLYGLDWPWAVLAGKAALVVLLVHGAIALWRRAMNIEFQRWLFLHRLGAPLVLAAGLVHSWFIGSDLRVPGMRILWLALGAVAGGLFLNQIALRLWRLKRQAYRVRKVSAETRGVYTLELVPPEGHDRFDFAPGQFHFLRFVEGRDQPVEEHPFTIAGSPASEGVLVSSIKRSGDFTSLIDRTRQGDRIAVHGAFGRFSLLLHPEETTVTFIAGGIGITPIMSMLRYMRDTGMDINAALLYANKTREDIAFADELRGMSSGEHPVVKLTHFLEEPPAGWEGQQGRITADHAGRFGAQPFAKSAFYICGPPPMMQGLLKGLKQKGISSRKIHYELFSF
ncbi:MAG: oxidoreductase [Chitinivibrionales bacterium]|nr:oxidoreductase [Chitinivibrionales bacterium]MBD3395286.1 oxidoreductase [Chitinivibrionales bacterium]